eukprot:Platyproteum_vivax@DN3577_c0_g1_i1.p1
MKIRWLSPVFAIQLVWTLCLLTNWFFQRDIYFFTSWSFALQTVFHFLMLVLFFVPNTIAYMALVGWLIWPAYALAIVVFFIGNVITIENPYVLKIHTWSLGLFINFYQHALPAVFNLLLCREYMAIFMKTSAFQWVWSPLQSVDGVSRWCHWTYYPRQTVCRVVHAASPFILGLTWMALHNFNQVYQTDFSALFLLGLYALSPLVAVLFLTANMGWGLYADPDSTQVGQEGTQMLERTADD